ncbi:MAG TPA: hypothetical protein VGB77_17015 [Abditibacteriaceae bacterium]|jgi:hypothetical protein
MKNFRHAWLVLSISAFALIGSLLFQSNGQTQPKPAPTGGIKLSNTISQEGTPSRVNVLATLFKVGEPVRSVTMHNISGNQYDGIETYGSWSDLPVGAYEVLFEAKGFGKVVKRVVVAPDATASVIIDSMDKNDELWGGGPTLFDLQKRIEALEAENKDLKARVSQLEKR